MEQLPERAIQILDDMLVKGHGRAPAVRNIRCHDCREMFSEVRCIEGGALVCDACYRRWIARVSMPAYLALRALSDGKQ